MSSALEEFRAQLRVKQRRTERFVRVMSGVAVFSASCAILAVFTGRHALWVGLSVAGLVVFFILFAVGWWKGIPLGPPDLL